MAAAPYLQGSPSAAWKREQVMKSIQSRASAALAGALALAFATSASAGNPMVGGAPMYSTKTIVQNAVNSKDHTTLVAAVKAAGLVDTLSGAGPFTVFAPTNAAFAKLPPGTVEALVKPERRVRAAAYGVTSARQALTRTG
jgi:uncharacterized surface protein with fasciclin (FAS1) repeats